MKKNKIYHVTGWVYVPLDGEVLATSKKEAKEKWLQVFKDTEFGFDVEPKFHEIYDNSGDKSIHKEEFKNEDVIFTNNKYFIK